MNEQEVKQDKGIDIIKKLDADALLQNSLPPGGGVEAIPFIQQFAGYTNLLYKSFRNNDVAIQTNREDARRMRSNLVIMEPFQARKMSTAHLPWHIECPDNHDSEQLKIAQGLTRIVDDIPDFLQMKLWLLDQGIWCGKGGVQIRYKWDWSFEAKKLVVRDWTPVNGDSLVFRWADDRVGVLILPYYIGTGTKDYNVVGETMVNEVGRFQLLSENDRKQFVLIKHNIEAPDFFEPERAGAIKGVGIRHYLFFPWRVMDETRAMLHTFIERVALGKLIIRYASGNPQEKDAAEKALKNYSIDNSLLLPGHPDLKYKDIEYLDPQPAGIDLLLKVVNDYYGQQIRKYIFGESSLGQALSNQSGGNKTSEINQDSTRRIIMTDSQCLAECLTRDLLSVLTQWNYPGCPWKFKFKFNLERRDPEELLRSAQAFYNMGGTISEDSLRTHLGLEKPTKDDTVLRRMLTTMEQDEAGKGSVGDTLDGNEKEGEEGGTNVTKVDAIKAAVEAMGPTAKASEVMSHLESQGIKASRSLVYNTLLTLRGTTQFKKKRKREKVPS